MLDLTVEGLRVQLQDAGGVWTEVAARRQDYAMYTPFKSLRYQGNGRFEELIDDSAEPHCSCGCAYRDFDNEGDMDILVVKLNQPPSLLRRISGNGWLSRPVKPGGKTHRAPSLMTATPDCSSSSQTSASIWL